MKIPATSVSRWTLTAGGDVYRSSGNVGVGTASPGGLLGLKNSSVYITVDASDNLVLVDPVAGTKTLSQLAAGGGSGGAFTGDGYILPLVDDAYGIGLPDQRWSDLFVGPDSIHIIGTLEDIGIERNWHIRLDTSGELVIEQGVDDKAKITVAGQLMVPSGTITQPSFSFLNDSNTGLYNPLPNSIGISSNGIEGLRITGGPAQPTIDAYGDVQIQGNSRLILPQLNSSTRPAIVFDGQETGIGTNNDMEISLIVNGVEGLRVTGGQGQPTIDAYGSIQIQGSSKLILPGVDDPVSPDISFGSTSGFYESAPGTIGTSHSGALVWQINANAFQSTSAGYPSMRREVATATNPIFVVQGDIDTGIGFAGADQVSIIGGGIEGIRVTEVAAAITVDVNGDLFVGDRLGVGTASPNAGAVVDISSTTGALLVPRMTSTQRDSLAALDSGMVIYNTTDNELEGYDGYDGYWKKLDQNFEAFRPVNIPDGYTQTIDFANGRNHVIDLVNAPGDVTLSLNNPQEGVVYILKIVQGPGAVDLIWPSSVLWQSAVQPIISTTDNAIDIIQLLYDGSVYLALFSQEFS